jgi:hypothetical protein
MVPIGTSAPVLITPRYRRKQKWQDEGHPGVLHLKEGFGLQVPCVQGLSADNLAILSTVRVEDRDQSTNHLRDEQV